MPYNLLLIPIVTGYFILTYSKLFKYNSQRISRARILFESLFVSLFIILFGFILRTIISILAPNLIPFLLKFLNRVPIEKPLYLWTFIFSSLISVIFISIINLIIKKYYPKNDPISRAVKSHGDELEILVNDSVENGHTIQLTLKNDKVYIGFCEETPIPNKTNYLSISPILSGYRDPKTKRLIITTDYFKVVDEFIRDIEEKEGVDHDEISLNTDIVIKQDEIITAGIFEQTIYDKFNNTNEPTPIPKD